jgi:hypothetical protein
VRTQCAAVLSTTALLSTQQVREETLGGFGGKKVAPTVIRLRGLVFKPFSPFLAFSSGVEPALDRVLSLLIVIFFCSILCSLRDCSPSPNTTTFNNGRC